ncbi:hypothetical protein BDN72DRAFT_732247, partial [Pluteus cervinus]
DLFSRICALMNIKEEEANLGWKNGDDPKRSLPQPLGSAKDVERAYETLGRLAGNKQRKKPVVMQVSNLTKASEPEKAKATPKQPSELAVCAETLQSVKAKLKCDNPGHHGPNRWCYVRQDEPHRGEHVPLGYKEVSHWARQIKLGHADDNCVDPPESLNLPALAAAQKAHENDHRSRGYSKGQKTEVHIHNHYDTAALEKSSQDSPAGPSKKRKHNSTDSEDSDGSDEEPQEIGDLLAALHSITPKYNFPQYQGALKSHGIEYTHIV